jgi:hypothetical protein
VTSRPSDPRTEITRLPEKANFDRAELDRLLDEIHVGHVALVAEGSPVVIPTAIARDGDTLLVHGSTGSRWMRLLGEGAAASVAVTAFDGLVVARSAFESSMLYRSAVLFGTLRPLTGTGKAHALDVITAALLPGRIPEIRKPTKKELAATLVLAMPIGQWSLKVSDKWPDDPPEDIAEGAWAGVIPAWTSYGRARPAPDLRAGIDAPPSVRAFETLVARREPPT